MKKHSTIFVIIFTALFMVLLTWLLPVTYLNGEFITAERSQVGLAQLFTYPTYLMYNFIYVFIYVILVGGFYAVLNKTGVYRTIVDKVVSLVRGKKMLFLSLTVLLLSVLVSFTGHTYEAIIIFPFIIAVVLLLGYDNITASMVTLGSVVTGIMGSTFSKIVNGTFMSMLNANSTIVKYTDLIWFKLGLLILSDVVLVLCIWLYVRKHEPSKKVEESMFIPKKVEKESKKWPLITILSVMAVLFIVGTLNWSDAFGISLFTDALEKFEALTIKGYPVLSKITGTLVAFGEWTYNEYMVMLFIATLLIKFIYHIKFEELFDTLFDGMKDYFYAAMVMLVSYVILIITSNHPVMLTILKPLLSITDGFNSLTLLVSTLVSALFNTDFTFYQYSILPLTYVTAYISDTSVYALCGFITQAMHGLAMLIAPTSVVLLFNLSALKIGYLEWLKNIWKLFVGLLLLSLITFTVILLVI